MGPNTITVPLSARARTDEELLERALTVARRTALGVLGDPEAAADVAQDVAVIVLRRSRFLKDPDRLDAWLHRVAVRAALRERKRGRRRQALEDEHHAQRPTPSADPGLGGILDLLEGLPARQRAALTLRYVHDLPDAAIARALGVREGAVRSLLSRGRTTLRQRLNEDRHA
jgi:RNA polymerase sigma-70 factor (ECF subfamily)